MSDVRVLVVDDERFRRAMAAVVEETDGFVVVGSVASGEDSLTAVSELAPDLVLMDVCVARGPAGPGRMSDYPDGGATA